jgi:hypothetical protein
MLRAMSGLAATSLNEQLRWVSAIAKLDRLARNVAFISLLMENGVEFVAADMLPPSKTEVVARSPTASAPRLGCLGRPMRWSALVVSRL